MSHRTRALMGAALACAVLATPAAAGTAKKADADNNGFSDAGVIVNGNYTDTYADGLGNVCSVLVTYRGDFGNDAYLDSGEISNHYVCNGPAGHSTYNYQIVSQGDPRYSGNPDWAVWGTWEYHVLTQGGQGNEDFGGNGNLVRPYKG